ncbi:hypothetical protein SCHPADRAFT_121751 [Schizopora paradoxa]|uniref:Uncharacterized protein n=1 Tax=Schizopora paradoxa TaxID=27342 RepID=A0A0H2S9E5_9AGAM|nr:hypothetical protein SCHPADRAFT_121751 [Schizopora paradoxa]
MSVNYPRLPLSLPFSSYLAPPCRGCASFLPPSIAGARASSSTSAFRHFRLFLTLFSSSCINVRRYETQRMCGCLEGRCMCMS